MAVFLFLLVSLGGVVVGDLVLEKPTADELIVFNQPVSGSRQGVLLAMAATLGSAVALLLVAWMSSTRARPARRTQLRAINAGRQRQGPRPSRSRSACWRRGSAATCPTATSASQPDEPRRSTSYRAIERIRQHVLQAHQRAG
jgi:hypothetical protein